VKRRSIVTDDMAISVCSGQPSECAHELIFGSGMREKAIEDGIVIPLTHKEHNMAVTLADRIHDNPRAEDLSKIAGQLAWEKEFYRKELKETADPAREAFRIRYGISYL